MPNIMSIQGGGTPGPHKTTHQDTGTDEISVTGLAGVLADEQYSAWAAVSGKPTTFAPSAHKTSHQSGGSDVLDASGLVGRINFIDRGDPAAGDYSKASFTIDGAWHDLDLSTIVPAGAKRVEFRTIIRNSGYNVSVKFRKKGRVNLINLFQAITQFGGVDIAYTFQIDCDANRVIQYYIENAGTWDTIFLVVLGWWL